MVDLSSVPIFDTAGQDFYRNIVSLRKSQDLFADLSTDPTDIALAQAVEDASKPPMFASDTPIIDRPFEDAAWANAIGYPFLNLNASRFSSGHFGVWYGSLTLLTTIHETVHHWLTGILADAEGYSAGTVTLERKVYVVRSSAMVVDLREQAARLPGLSDKTDYGFCRQIGQRLYDAGQPGLLTRSVRDPSPESCNLAAFRPDILSSARDYCYLTYQLDAGQVAVWRDVDAAPVLTLAS